MMAVIPAILPPVLRLVPEDVELVRLLSNSDYTGVPTPEPDGAQEWVGTDEWIGTDEW